MRHQAQPLAAVPPQGAEGRQGRGSPLVAEDTALAVQGARLAGLLHLETGSDEENECGCRVANRAARARRGKHAATRSGEDAHHFAVCDVLLATGEASRIKQASPGFSFFVGRQKIAIIGFGGGEPSRTANVVRPGVLALTPSQAVGPQLHWSRDPTVSTAHSQNRHRGEPTARPACTLSSSCMPRRP